ncbi:MAG TPA: ATP-binding protein [Candidatus Saccharimonadales bacterium]|nr:ATP-binding protein [Candidatus Saccharimonadales bacterium]
MNVKLRLYGFAVAVVLLAALVGWTGQTSWQKLKQLRKNFGAVQSERFHLAEHVEASSLNLNETVLRFDLRKDPADKAHFHKESEELKRWIETQKSSVTTPLELDLLNQIQVALEAYLTRTTNLLEERAKAGTIPSPKEILEKVENKAQILDLCMKLKAAERAGLNQFLEDSNGALGGLQRLLMALVALVLILGFTATSLIYRVKIAPLRAQLVESRAIIERQEKLASLGTLAAGVAHEIRNPLTAINVRLHSLKRTLVQGSSEHEDATVIDQEIQRLDRIVRDVLHFARPAEPRPVTIAAESLFRRMQGLLGSQLEKSIRLNLASSPALWIRVDPQQIEQVLINLIQNAAESIGRDGAITLRARSTVMPLAGHATPVVILEVIDTGKGIPLKVQERLFDPFFTTKEAGTGLGLSIAARIVEKHGGALQYQTEVDRGTTFGIVLPRVEKDADEVATENFTR